MLNILYADDNRCLAEVTKLLLMRAGHTVEIVSDGFDAWERISRNPHCFQVLITDHRMPGFSGLELLHVVRQSEFAGRIIVYSGALTPANIEAYRAFNVDEIVSKAPDQRLLRVLEKYAGRETPHDGT